MVFKRSIPINNSIWMRCLMISICSTQICLIGSKIDVYVYLLKSASRMDVKDGVMIFCPLSIHRKKINTLIQRIILEILLLTQSSMQSLYHILVLFSPNQLIGYIFCSILSLRANLLTREYNNDYNLIFHNSSIINFTLILISFSFFKASCKLASIVSVKLLISILFSFSFSCAPLKHILLFSSSFFESNINFITNYRDTQIFSIVNIQIEIFGPS